ncbi:UPF0223 family protein [Melissococcus plutonius]|uniref:Uncharacterized protein n=2 Tax=Melissococcus plutonius TaxID=33970 RepID=F3YB33_MELPT|nr:UPF0223 family protein [Melissococcus plutonius]BAL61939.1 hypothetical protein MPD5_0692 [Melissococcus plutonius DAT561]AIM25138.1 hypothetical protein MEPL_c012100 [Melissococcus plutonius S1]KMT25391.1 hypothetical protein MEPL2_2c09570 [Melissococcus plutonius]KMT25660.1 hypothetical protein MEPL3_4c00600 [Melissococcus plutonius]KMT26295.1 hypothetical protein MEPL1_5c00600 [Melissococcus plutonius]
MKNYQYPLELDWTKEEIIIVTRLWAAVEQANETGIEVNEFMKTYRTFKTVIPSIGEEKALGKKFQKVSGYSLYQTLQQAKGMEKGLLKLEDK